jgi:cytosine/uracil/thiamine/allantoin permease
MKVPRIGMTLVTLLSVNTMINAIKNQMPRVTYLTISDIWLYPITYYCCICLFEFLIVQHLVELEKPHTAKKIEFWSRIVLGIIPLLYMAVYLGVVLGATDHCAAEPRSYTLDSCTVLGSADECEAVCNPGG